MKTFILIYLTLEKTLSWNKYESNIKVEDEKLTNMLVLAATRKIAAV
jgi:hypothetical protein